MADKERKIGHGNYNIAKESECVIGEWINQKGIDEKTVLWKKFPKKNGRKLHFQFCIVLGYANEVMENLIKNIFVENHHVWRWLWGVWVLFLV